MTIQSDEIKVENGSTSAGGTGAAAFSAPTTIINPRPLRPDDGRWQALGAIVGAVVGKMASKTYMKQVDRAMDEWDRINDKLKFTGYGLLDDAPKEKAKQENEANNIYKLLGWGDGIRDEQLQRARGMDACLDMTYEELCQYVKCGYKPDYAGIYKRINADTQTAIAKQRAELCKNLNRYAVRQCCAVETAMATAAIKSAVGSIAVAREKERSTQYQVNEQLYMKTAELMERARQGRLQDAMNINKDAIATRNSLFTTRSAAYLDYIRLGGDLLASVGTNLTSKAQSASVMADKTADGISAVLAGLVALAFSWDKINSDQGAC